MSANMDSSNVPERLLHWAKQHPNSEAFVFIGKDGSRAVLTCEEIFDKAVHFARQLKQLGLKPGDIVCSLLPDSSPNGFIAFFGIMVAGCVVFNGKLQLKDGTFLIQNLNKMKCKAFILSSDRNEPCHKLMAGLLEFSDGHQVSSTVLVHIENVVFTKDDPEIGFNWMVQESQSHQGEGFVDDFLSLDANADAVILLSSGTTGMSKMIVHSHSVFMSYLDSYTMNSKSGAICYYSLNWGPGLPVYYMVTGLKTVLIDQRFMVEFCDLPKFTVEHVLKENCDVISAALDDLFLITKAIKTNAIPDNWPAVCSLGGRPLSKSNVDILKGYFSTIYNMYCCTEGFFVSFKKITKNTEFEDFNTGTPMVAVAIKDENNAVLPNEKSGNVYIKTKTMFKRYFGDEELTNSAFDDEGYFITTDLGYFNSHGDLIIFGRKKDVIERSEDYFHPVWIENIIRTCPDVKDVIVVKVPDVNRGDEICACVVLVPGSNYTVGKIEDFCKDTFVEDDYEHVTACPRYFLLLDKIPLNRNKKVDRLAAEKYAAEVLSL